MIILKSEPEIETMATAGWILNQVLKSLVAYVRPGVTTVYLDELAEEMIRSHGAEPAFKGYRDYPATLCASVNEQAVHGIPSKRKLKAGDLLSLDLGAIWRGYYADAAVSMAVYPAYIQALDLVDITREALAEGIRQVRPGNHVSDISHAIQTYAERMGYRVVESLGGHGIGTALHEPPFVANEGPPGRGPRLVPGMVLAIEPVLTAGSGAIRTLQDGWTVVTADKSLAAHFEHTVAVTEGGCRVLTGG